MSRGTVTLFVLLAIAVGAQSQSITDTINNLNPTCKPLVLGVVGNCTTELVAAANAVGVSFPPKEGETASQEAVQAYADTNPNIGFNCCRAVCYLTDVGCGCDDGTYNALVSSLAGSLDFAVTVLEQVKNQCTVQNVNFVVTLKGYKNAAGEEVCGADPGITCPA